MREFFTSLGLKGVGMVRLDARDQEDTFATLYASAPGTDSLGEEGPLQTGRVHKSRTQIVDEIERILRARYSQELSLEGIAREMHFTPNYIGAVFKAAKRISFNHYLMQVRMERACQLLSQSRASINDIAITCGFRSIPYFHTCFKKIYGVTPGEYRREHLGMPL